MKIYISKSNRSNPNHISLVRQYCLDNNIEVIEYLGGNYKDFIDEPLKADKFIIIGHSQSLISDNTQYQIGKGQTDEAKHFAINGKGKSNMFVADQGINIFSINSIKILGSEEANWALSCSIINLGDNTLTLKEILS